MTNCNGCGFPVGSKNFVVMTLRPLGALVFSRNFIGPINLDSEDTILMHESCWLEGAQYRHICHNPIRFNK